MRILTARSLMILTVVLITVASAGATPITYFDTGTGSGSIGATVFTNAPFTIHATGDTTNRQAFAGGWSIPNTAADITIDGLGTFNFVTSSHFFVANNNSIVGFSRGPVIGLDLYNGPTNSAFSTWDMLSSIGPISGSGSLLQWTNIPVNTSGGVLVFNDGSTDARFQAIVGATAVPEPTTITLLGTGLAFAGRRCRRRGRLLWRETGAVLQHRSP